MIVEPEQEYNYLEVKDIVRDKQLYILNKVVDICNKYNLKYWLDGGTLLGAVRHGGFIPWDDDIDIALMREDYNILRNILLQELPEDLILQDMYTDSKFNYLYMCVRDKYSIIEDKYEHNGIFIDIFPFDYLPDRKYIRSLQSQLLTIRDIAFVYPEDIGKLSFVSKKTFYAYIKKSILYISIFVLRRSKKFGFRLIDKFIHFLSGYNSKRFIGDGLMGYWAYYRSTRTKDVYFPLSKVTFENTEYNAPNNIDEYLSTLYGVNYMTPIATKEEWNKVIFLKGKRQ